MFTSILVPFDKSEHALHALELAKGLALEDEHTELHVLDVIYISEMPPSLGLDANPFGGPPPLSVDPEIYQNLVQNAVEREKIEMDGIIGDLLQELKNPVNVLALNAPSIVDGINEYAHDHRCDLIVMGSRGLGMLRGMLGSVSYGVLRSSDIPVLIAKSPEED